MYHRLKTGLRTVSFLVVFWTISVSADKTPAAYVELTGLVVVASDSTGNDPGFGGGIWTTSTQKYHRLWVNKGSLGGLFVNGPEAQDAGIRIPMANGIHTYTIQATGSYIGVDTFAFNMFFNDCTDATQISAYAPLHDGGEFPSFHVNSSPKTSG